MSSVSIHSNDSKETALFPNLGSHKVKYNPHSEWDFHLDVTNEPIDLNLILPHYRARNQPPHHRLNMFVGQEAGSLELKVCRTSLRNKFSLEVQAPASNITVWLPSDFKGRIRHTGKAVYSSGFVSQIKPNAKINQRTRDDDSDNEDEVVILTTRSIGFRVWDVQTREAEHPQRDALKRIFRLPRKQPVPTDNSEVVNWDFLVDY